MTHPEYYEREYGNDEIIRTLKLDFTFYYNINDFLVFISKRILRKLLITGNLQLFLPKLKIYMRSRLFDREIDFEYEKTMKKINHPLVIKKIYEIFFNKISRLTMQTKEMKKITMLTKVSETPGFLTSKKLYSYTKTVYNYLVFDSSLEKGFADLLDNDNSVIGFCRIFPAMRFWMFYVNKGFLKRYIPDFLIKTTDGQFYLVELKGEGFANKYDVKLKNDAVIRWIEKAGQKWSYLFITENDFKNFYSKTTFPEIIKDIKEGNDNE